MTETGIRRTEDGGVFFEKCGSDLSADGSAMFSAHLDGIDFYENQFTCTECGAVLSQRYERTAEDKRWWGGEDAEQ